MPNPISNNDNIFKKTVTQKPATEANVTQKQNEDKPASIFEDEPKEERFRDIGDLRKDDYAKIEEFQAEKEDYMNRLDSGLFNTIAEFENDYLNDSETTYDDIGLLDYLLNDVYKLPDNEKSEAIDTLISSFDDIIRNGDFNNDNTSNIGMRGYLISALYDVENKDETTTDFMGKFLSECSDESYNTLLSNNIVNRYMELAPQNKYVLRLNERRDKFNDSNLNLTQKLDNDSSQDKIRDSWLLSGLNALSYSETGSKILDHAINETENGFSVNFVGLDKKVDIADSEIVSAIETRDYSMGDADMLLYELAFEKARKDKNISLDADNTNAAIFELTGVQPNIVHNPARVDIGLMVDYKIAETNPEFDIENYNEELNFLLDEIENSDDVIATIGFNYDKKSEFLTDIYGNKHETSSAVDGGHVWSVKSVNGDNVTIINPWNNNKDVVVSRDELSKNIYKMTYFNLSGFCG